MDRIWEGEEAMISVILTRWNENVLAKIMSRPNYAGARGFNTANDIGTLVGSEGMTYPVWLAFPYSPLNVGGKAAMTGMPAGYRFWSCMNISDNKGTGTKFNKHHVMFHAMRAWNNNTQPVGPAVVGSFSNAAVGASFKLYDHNMSAITANLFN